MKKLLAECPVKTISESPFMSMEGMGWTTVSNVDIDDREVRVCDLNVPDTHCFLTNGLVVHNSGSIEQDADLVLFLYREEYYLQRSEPSRRANETLIHFTGRLADWEGLMTSVKNRAEVIIAKNRHGPTDTAHLRFIPHITRFKDLVDDNAPPAEEIF